MGRTCYHYSVKDGTCGDCGTAVSMVPGNELRATFDPTSDTAPVARLWVDGTDTLSVGRALAAILGVTSADIVVIDVTPGTDGWRPGLLVTWTLRGSRVEVTTRLDITPSERKDPEWTKVEDEAEVAEAS